MQVDLKDLLYIYESEVKRNFKNKVKVNTFERNKICYLIDIKKRLESGKYDGGRYNIFLVFKPKVRVVMSQGVYDKIINHYIARFIIMKKFDKYLLNENCATRKGMGTDYAIKLLKRKIEKYKKYDKFYFLKIDISKYFYRIDHNVLLNLLKKDLTKEEYLLISTILNSTNKPYINNTIKKYREKYNLDLPFYEYNKGLSIGCMTNQFLAIFYLSKLQFYMKNNLHLDFVNYMDDYIIIHESKEYLEECIKKIEEILNREYKLELNKTKTFIKAANEGVSFLGYNFKVISKKTIVNLIKKSKTNIKKGIKRTKYLYENNYINFEQLFSSIECYKNSYKYEKRKAIKNIIEKNWY